MIANPGKPRAVRSKRRTSRSRPYQGPVFRGGPRLAVAALPVPARLLHRRSAERDPARGRADAGVRPQSRSKRRLAGGGVQVVRIDATERVAHLLLVVL